MSKMTDQEVINDPVVFSALRNYPPCIWNETFANYTFDTEVWLMFRIMECCNSSLVRKNTIEYEYQNQKREIIEEADAHRINKWVIAISLWEKYSTEVAELKEKVRSMLLLEELNVAEKLILIDTLERLGVAYHFEDDIEEILKQLFNSYDYNEDYDLSNVSLHFRIFRQHGHNMSCDVFRNYRGRDGKQQETLKNDLMGMLGLYEAANLAIHGEDILDEALVFTKTNLTTMIPKLNTRLAEEVKRALDLCLQRRLPRIEARNYIETYQSNPLKNETLLYFAKIDFNMVQMLHLQEVSAVTKWCNDKGAELPHLGDLVSEIFFWGIGVYFEPRYTAGRITFAKLNLVYLLLDDTYTSHGTLDELKLFTEAVEMWDANVVHLIPDSLKLLYKCLLDLFEELDHQYMAQGKYRALSCVKQEIKNYVRSYYNETKWWFKKEEMLSFDEYLANGLVTVAFFVLIASATLDMKEAVTNEEVFDWFQSKPDICISIATIWRLVNDICTYEIRKAKGHAVTGMECYMNQFGVSKEDTVKEFKHMIEKAWKDFNEKRLKSTPIPKHLMDLLVNHARTGYLYINDPYTNPEMYLKDQMVSALLNPIPLF